MDSRECIHNKLLKGSANFQRSYLTFKIFNYPYCVCAHKVIFPETGVTGSYELRRMGAGNKLKLSFVRAVYTFNH